METRMAIARIDKEIIKYSLLLSDLRAERNSLSSVFSLPTDILTSIFIYGARDYYESNNRPSFRVPCWVNVSYVCRHWRSVALNCPTLWTYHFIVSLRWTNELLARSKQAPSKIRIKYNPDKSTDWWSDLIKQVLHHIERIQELRISIRAWLFPTTLSFSAPCLQILDLCSPEHPTGHPTKTKYGDMDIPLLHTLKLSAYPLPWGEINLSRVTTLILTRVPPTSTLSVIELLKRLSRMPALTVLHLDCALVAAPKLLSSGTCSMSPKVGLPHLARLFVAAPLSAVVAFLSCINIPLKTRVMLHTLGEKDSSADDFALFCLLVGEIFNQSEDLLSLGPTIRSLIISSDMEELTFAVYASERRDCNPLLSVDVNPPQECIASLIICVEMDTRAVSRLSPDSIIGDICCSIPSTHVQTLYAVDPPRSPDNFWRRALGRLRGLQYMKLSGYVPDLAPLLALPAAADEPLVTPRGHAEDDHDLTGGPKFVPALEELELSYPRGSRLMDENSHYHRSLRDALSTRNARLTITDYASDGSIVDDGDSSSSEDDDIYWLL